jgi:hypothetical protein
VAGLREVRAIVHLHSHWSHDACDRNPQPEGIPDEECLADLRYGLCTTRIDVAFLTDHPTHAEEAMLSERLLERDGDELVFNDAGDAIGAWLACDDGHRTLLLPGLEDDLMPLGQQADVWGAANDRTVENVEILRNAGAVVWQAHTEERTVEELAPLGLDGVELYQLHANLDPDARELMGLEPFGYLGDVAPFFFAEANGIEDPPHPDLAPLGFLAPNEPAARVLEGLGQTQRIGMTAGTDAHQNVFPTDAHDGERIDSYRRMMRWFNNRLRVEPPLSPESARGALRAANNHAVFEVFGTPLNFDFFGERDGERFEIGAEITRNDTPLRLRVILPSLDPRSPRGPSEPELRGVLYRADGSGRTIVQEWTEGSIDLAATDPGVYRVEVYIVPLHLEPYLGEVVEEYVTRELLWIQTSPIFVR